MFIGAAGGVALSHLPGLGLIPAAAIGIGAATAAMLRLPFTAVLLTTLFLGSDVLQRWLGSPEGRAAAPTDPRRTRAFESAAAPAKSLAPTTRIDLEELWAQARKGCL